MTHVADSGFFLQESGYNDRYYTEHYTGKFDLLSIRRRENKGLQLLTGKSRVGDWLQAQPSEPTNTGMSWSIISTGPYMDMLLAVRLINDLCQASHSPDHTALLRTLEAA